MAVLRDQKMQCSRCGLSKTRNHVIFGEGNLSARILIIGEDLGLKRDTWEDFKKIVCKYRELVDPDHHSDYI
ncbi:MAG: hypothetical protein EOM36_00350 [Bacteroidia bacterium]|nr:hypothetical protein [Bacteroidia bacterium]